ncbi:MULTISPECIES: nuclease-related domain-containing DEAD/DEAH box helicase [Brevibacterium]|uniref:NERD domain protein n=1 Tax=Brevibacterium aurantiacum TaxID=273384 RepID=A0A2A3Z929_BREAU|nr:MULTISPECIES: NERD domain-containing protein [Brevibacterium]AZL05334.1 NERD domain protein [Brevibacterium aurantiacum]AZL08916.1 NERD domain protein [Brevibacterium aurantiacum]AZL12524.1 NERD domain protein [Brevibacterium aurantiacum]MDN5712522.1 NERD domain-containing protein [Brevibacterium aurantiacum]MDN5735218.1 NERD domain-containing protein [Brevibacterium aurantiacum]
MVTLIPQQPDFNGSTAEAAVWNALCEQLPEDATMVHGQRLTGDDKDVEIDILVLWPGFGIAVIEVKGGRVSVEDGRWITQDAQGHRNRLKVSPLEQAMVAKHTLVDYLHSRVSTLPGPISHLAVLPYTQLPQGWDQPDALRGQLIDSTQLDSIAGAISTQLRYDFTPERDNISIPHEFVLKNLRRTNQAVENVSLRATEISDRADELSREQAKLISILRHQNRAEISGGAGTGKTYLALLKSQALTREGKRVALMCYSRGLGRFLQLFTAQWPEEDRPAYVGLFHDLPISWGAAPGSDDDSEYWEHHLPRQLKDLADERPRKNLFDAIVIDEGQDFSLLWWEAVQSCLRNQVDGTLYVFTDERQRIFGREGASPITMNPIQLDENLRNSEQIVAGFADLALDPPIPRNGPGEEIDWVETDLESALAEADGQVESLMDAGWNPDDIALLTTGSRHPEQRSIVETEGTSAYWDQFFATEDVFYGHVLGFKGLERPVVVLCLNGFRDPDRAVDMLYVGMSRATTKLVVVGDMSAFDQIYEN